MVSMVAKGLEHRGRLVEGEDLTEVIHAVLDEIDRAPGGPIERGQNVPRKEYLKALKRWSSGVEAENVWRSWRRS